MALKRGRGSLRQAGDTIVLKDGAADETTLAKGANAGTATFTFPNQTGTKTLVSIDSADSLTNKTLGITNTVTLKDTLFTVQDDGDLTKQAKFQSSGITTGTTRTFTFPDGDTTLVGTDLAQTLTNKTLTAPTIAAGTVSSLTGLSVRDTSAAFDVTLAATSSTPLTAGRTLTLNLDNGARALGLKKDLTVDTGPVTLSGQAGGSSVTLPSAGTLATLAGIETLTNKTLTSPTINGGTFAPSTLTVTDNSGFTIQDNVDATKQARFELSGITSGNTRTLTLPDASITLVGTTATQTITNKTITSATNILSGATATNFTNVGTVSLPAVTTTLVGRDTTDTLTNKTFDADGTGNSISNIENADIKAGAAIDATKIAGGTVSNTEFGYLDGVTSAIQTQLDGKQPLDADLTALAALATTGLIARTASGTVATRTVTAGSTKISITNGDGVAGNPTVDAVEANFTHDNIGGTLGIAKGGTGQTTQTNAFDALAPNTTKGDLIAYNGSDNIRVAVGANGTVLTADSAATAGVSWGTAAVTPAEGYVYSTGTVLATVGDFAGDANKVAGINNAATAPEYKSLLAGTAGTDFAVAHAAGSVTYNLPDAGAAARGVVTTGTQTLAGAKTFSEETTHSSQVRIASGTVTEPSIVFSADDDGTGTGFYRSAANNIDFASNGVNVGNITAAGLWSLGPSGSGTGYHNINANLDINSGAAATGGNGYAQRITKTNSTTTADGNFFFSFGVNSTLSNSGRISTNGANAAAFFSTSDARLKTNVETLVGGLATIVGLRPVEFEWIEHPGVRVKGFIAQETKDIVPEAVSALEDENAGFYSMCRENFIPYLVAAIKELKQEFDTYVAEHP